MTPRKPVEELQRRKSETVNLCGCGSCPVCRVFQTWEREYEQKRIKNKLNAAPLKGPRPNKGYVSPELARKIAAMGRRDRGRFIRRLARAKGLPYREHSVRTPSGRVTVRRSVETAHIYQFLRKTYPWWSLRIRDTLRFLTTESHRAAI